MTFWLVRNCLVSLWIAREVYLSGPTLGLPGRNLRAFVAASEELRSFGFRVTSLHELPEGDYLAAVSRTGAVVMLPGWEDSPSCGIENLYAEALGRPVWTIEEIRLAQELSLVA